MVAEQAMGPNDEAGSTNFYTALEVVKRALAEAK